MNFMMIFILLAAGFGVSFIVLDVSRVAGRRHWPASHDVVRNNFRPFAIFLALFAGPALLAHALRRMLLSGGLRTGDGVAGIAIACGWACCYGVVVVECVRLAGLPAP
ncbi:DUF6949 family protein [Rhizobium giardinii]|uniref:DUF6949 family protein n=1 Tax=Rhizobium giardinii TaxID=56731 RepID=UPI000DD72206